MSIGYRELLGIGVCPACNVIYKLRTGYDPKDGVHRCNICGNVIRDIQAADDQ